MVIGLVVFLVGCNFTSSTDDKKEDKPKEETEKKESDSKDSEPSGATEQVLNLTISEELGSMDILKEHGVLTPIANTLEGLYSIGQDQQPMLTGAESHDESDDGLVHTFKIRDNVWSNGDPVTAEDYVYSWRRTLEEVGYYAYMFGDSKVLNAKDIEEGNKPVEELGIEAVDEKTLVITLEEPYPLFKYSLAFPALGPVNKTMVESAGDQYGQAADKVVYNGPFILSDWKPSQGWTYKKNPDYWDAANVKLEEVNVSIVKEESTAVNLYESGEIDVVEISSAFIDRYSSDPNYFSEPKAGIRFMRFNHNHDLLSNVKARRAIDNAWEKEPLTDVILKNGSIASYFLVPDIPITPSGETYREVNGDFKVSLEEAQSLWKEAMDETGLDKVELDMLTADETDDKATAEYLKDQLEKNLEGLTVNIVLQPFQNRLDLEKAIDYDLSLSSYTPSIADPQNYLSMWREGDSFNRMDYVNKEFDEMVNTARSTIDEEERYDLMLEAEKLLFEDAAIAPMFQQARAVVMDPKVKDLYFFATIPDYDLRWAYIEE